MKIHFCQSSLPAAWIIRIGTMSQWSHVAAEVNGVVFQATAFGGVNVTTPEALRERYRIESVQVSGMDADAAVRFLRAQLGKKYDWGAVFGMFFRAKWHDEGKWFCSELIAAALDAGGHRLRLAGHRVTPRVLWVALPG